MAANFSNSDCFELERLFESQQSVVGVDGLDRVAAQITCRAIEKAINRHSPEQEVSRRQTFFAPTPNPRATRSTAIIGNGCFRGVR